VFGFESRVEGLGFRILVLGLRASCLVCQVIVLEFRVEGLSLRTWREKRTTKRNQRVKKQQAESQLPIVDPPNSAPTNCRCWVGWGGSGRLGEGGREGERGGGEGGDGGRLGEGRSAPTNCRGGGGLLDRF
jgi:hypothetical protein